MLALFALVILLTGILSTEAGQEDETVITVTTEHSVENAGQSVVPNMKDTLPMSIYDPFGNGRLFQAGIPVCIETDLYFLFPEETTNWRIRIGQQPWQEADSSCYRLHYARVCQLPAKQIIICFAACDTDGRYLEQEFCFFVK